MGCKSSIMLAFDSASKLQQRNSEDGKTVASIKSAILIQKWYRSYQARLETRRRCNWMIYQTIEYSGEQDQLKLHNFFMDLLALVDQRSTSENSLFTDALNKSKSIDGSQTVENTIEVDSSYTGPKLEFPITLKNITSLIQAFSNQQTIHAHYVFELLIHAREHLRIRPNISQVDTSLSKQVTVCGDLHGQLQDLIYIFDHNRYPDASNPYVFNGDFVDRGKYSVEILVILFSFQLLYPNAVFLNRGNHEDKVMNLRYGFTKEVQQKYKDHANNLLNLFSDVFRLLPLATVINKKIFVCHGGISNRVQLSTLNSIDRTKFISVLNGPSDTPSELNEWLQVLDVLWSDPKPQKGCKPNQYRGGGCYFGPDSSQQFLDRHQLEMIVRSHECKPEGHEWCHDNRVLTVFSASNYYEAGSNRGSIVKFLGSASDPLDPKIVTYNASKDLRDNKISHHHNHNIHKVEESAMKELRSKIHSNRSRLMQAFLASDLKETGSIEVQSWCQIMTDVINLDLPWHTLKLQLAKVDSKGLILYASTFEIMMQHTGSDANLNKSGVSEELYKYRDTLETVFRILDTDNSGKISLEEFKEGCLILRKHSDINITSTSMEDLARSIDINKDGSIDLNEFLEAFRITEDT